MMLKTKLLLGAYVVTLWVAVPYASAITLVEIARVDVSGQFNDTTLNGSNPSAVAWDGRQLFVAGFATGTAGSTGIVRYDDVLSSPVVGAEFGQLATPGSRGYSGLDISAAGLAAAYDDGAADPNGLQLLNSAGTQLFAKNIRGGSGVAFDPGFGGVDSGVAWTTFGSGRRALQSVADFSDIYTTADGMIITPDFASSFWRDMDFDDQGNMVARRSNDLVSFIRSGGNAGTAGFLVDNGENAQFVNGQNVAWAYNSPGGSFVIWNDRTGTGLGQVATGVLKAHQFDGTALPLSLSLLGGGSLPDGNGYYDFSWDAASQTLALLDFNNRSVHIFQIPEPITLGWMLLAGWGACVARRRVMKR